MPDPYQKQKWKQIENYVDKGHRGGGVYKKMPKETLLRGGKKSWHVKTVRDHWSENTHLKKGEIKSIIGHAGGWRPFS